MWCDWAAALRSSGARCNDGDCIENNRKEKLFVKKEGINQKQGKFRLKLIHVQKMKLLKIIFIKA